MGPLRIDYTCQCAAGYTGPRCEGKIDDCQSAKVFAYARNSNYPCIAATSSATGSELSGKKNATSILLAIANCTFVSDVTDHRCCHHGDDNCGDH